MHTLTTHPLKLYTTHARIHHLQVPSIHPVGSVTTVVEIYHQTTQAASLVYKLSDWTHPQLLSHQPQDHSTPSLLPVHTKYHDGHGGHGLFHRARSSP